LGGVFTDDCALGVEKVEIFKGHVRVGVFGLL